MDALEERIHRHGAELFERIRGQKPSIFNARSIPGRMMSWSLRNEGLKTQLFRLVDVLPALGSSREVAEHVRLYLGDGEAPSWLRWGAKTAGFAPPLTRWMAEKAVKQLAAQFILAEDFEKALPRLKTLREGGLTFTVDLLGETVVSEVEAGRFQDNYLGLIERLSDEAAKWEEKAIDLDGRGKIPKVNVSIKLSSLYSQAKAVDTRGSIEALKAAVRPLLVVAAERGVFVNFDMESTALKEITLEVFKELIREPALRSYRHLGIAIQAYLKSSGQDLEELSHVAREREVPVTVRLIKGAYWDYEWALAAQRGWPTPVFGQKQETDANYEKLSRYLLGNAELFDAAFGTHNLRSIAACIGMAEELGLKRHSYEFQMLYGMAEPIKSALIAEGFRVREYAPLGETLAGMSYLVRRLLENSSNEGFLRAGFGDGVPLEELLEKPGGLFENEKSTQKPLKFQNEPLTDWTIKSNRKKMESAILKVRARLGKRWKAIINGRTVTTPQMSESNNPARPEQIVAFVASCDEALAEQAIGAAKKAYASWSKTSVEERAGLCEQLAELIRESRFELAALEMFETGKNWIESDGDAGEAIDFCRFYAREMRRIGRGDFNLPGEENEHLYLGRGVTVVIAPWNFPLAILCGMTTAALVTGNCVVMKPAEQSAAVGGQFADLLKKAGFPDGTFAFLPGEGEIIGKYLVEHKDVQTIAFTGSKEVGLKIWQAAGVTVPGQEHLKRVICEMGGKNAIIVDSDADWDEAVAAIMKSAFGYAGQKCSALSRLILCGNQTADFMRRIGEATASLKIGNPEDPSTVVGPVISKEAYARIVGYIELGRKEARFVYEGKVPNGLKGYFIAPTIFADVPVTSRLWREEIFGPVLCIARADNFEKGLKLATESEFALTGGVFSRNPRHIRMAREEFRVGNLYINRGITGALVGRQPFGGFRMSGGGTKAGGAEYLFNFLYPRTITENTMRRGFTPPQAKAGE